MAKNIFAILHSFPFFSLLPGETVADAAASDADVAGSFCITSPKESELNSFNIFFFPTYFSACRCCGYARKLAEN